MKRNTLIICFCIFALMFVACDRGENYFHEWEGEYTMETHSFVIDSNGNEGHSFPTIFSTISVFFKGNNIFVSTNHFGKPNIDLENAEQYEETLIPSTNYIMDSVSGVYYVCRDGYIVTINELNEEIKSKPIPVISATANQLFFKNSELFELYYTDADGIIYVSDKSYFTYSSIHKEDERYIWDIELKISKPSSSFAGIRYHNVLTKK